MNHFEEKIKNHWSKLKDEDIEKLRGHWDEIPVMLQRVYGYRWKEAEEAYQQFRATLEPEWNLEFEDRSSPNRDYGSPGDHHGDEHHSI